MTICTLLNRVSIRFASDQRHTETTGKILLVCIYRLIINPEHLASVLSTFPLAATVLADTATVKYLAPFAT